MPDEITGRKALEESFFARENAKLVEKLRAERLRQSTRESLAALSGIADTALLDALAQLGINGETWIAMSLAPLVEVAWADGTVEEKERRAVLAAAEAHGVKAGSASHALLEGWLSSRPDARLLQAWREYMRDLCGRLSPPERELLKGQVLGRARAVAEAAGGILGFGNKVSEPEERTLRELESAFDAR